VTLNQPVRINDKEQFPALDGKNDSVESRTVQALPERENFNNVVRGTRSERGSRGRGSRGGGGFGGRGGKMENSGKPRSDYSANQRLQKEPRPVENVQPISREKTRENKSRENERLENHKGSKGHQDKTKVNPNDSPPSNRKVNLMVSIEGQNKRYSNNRQGGPRNSNNPRHPRSERGGDRGGDRTDPNAETNKEYYENGSANSASPGQGNFQFFSINSLKNVELMDQFRKKRGIELVLVVSVIFS